MGWRQRWERSRFFRHVGQLAGANALAQALPLLAAPLLARLYSPGDFAVLAVFGSALSMLLAFATLRFDWSVPQARGQGMAAALVLWALLALLAVVVLLAIAAAVWPLWPTALSGAGGAGAWPAWAAVLLPVALLGGGVQQLRQSWQIRLAVLAPVAWSRIVQGLVTVAVPLVAWPWLSPTLGALGLVLGAVVGAWLALLPYAPPFRRAGAGLLPALRRLSCRRLVLAGRRFGTEALWSTLVSVLNAASFALVPVLLLRHHGLAEVGWWALVHRVALAPVGLVTSAVSQGFWAEAAQLVRTDPGALERLYRRNTRRLLGLGLVLGGVALGGPLYVGPIFGADQWQQAGWVLAASAPLVVGIVAGSPLSHLVIHHRQHWQAGWDAVRIVLVVVAIEAAARAGLGLVGTVAVLSAVMGAMYGVLVGLNLAACRRRAAGVEQAMSGG